MVYFDLLYEDVSLLTVMMVTWVKDIICMALGAQDHHKQVRSNASTMHYVYKQ